MPCSTSWQRSINMLLINLSPHCEVSGRGGLRHFSQRHNVYFVAKIPPTTLVMTNLPSRSNQRVATSVIFPINASYSSFPVNMDVQSFLSSLKDARTYSMNGATSGKVR